MSDETESKNEGASGAPNGQAGAESTPVWRLVSQYIKDLSFENPNAPASILSANVMPRFDVNINVGVNRLPENLFGVDMTLKAKAMRDDLVLFNIELVYGGAFLVRNIPEQQLAPLLMIESPRLLFPFARQILASISQQGGFPPLMMEPVDFAAIYRSNLAAIAKAQQEQGARAAAEPAKPDA
jgi:preprotein translocase subunit SecB